MYEYMYVFVAMYCCWFIFTVERLEKEQLEKEQILRETIEADAQVLVRDVEYSQVLVRQMRQTGILPGVNVASKGQAVEPSGNNTKKYIEVGRGVLYLFWYLCSDIYRLVFALSLKLIAVHLL